MRLRYRGSAARWGFVIHLASKDGYEVVALPTGRPPDSPKMRWTRPAASFWAHRMDPSPTK